MLFRDNIFFNWQLFSSKMFYKRNIFFVISIRALLTLVIFTFFSCRENILSSKNPIGNINEPIKTKSFDSYTFEINASKITFNETDDTELNITRADVLVSVKNYSSGIVSITVIGDNKLNLYSLSFTGNTTGQSAKITNHVPEKVKLEFRNFSGNFKLRISKSN